MIFGDAGSGSVPDTIVGGVGELELAAELTGNEPVSPALAMPIGNTNNANKSMKAHFFGLEFNISLSPLQRELRWAETRNSEH
jgi:hypothetical protein